MRLLDEPRLVRLEGGVDDALPFASRKFPDLVTMVAVALVAFVGPAGGVADFDDFLRQDKPDAADVPIGTRAGAEAGQGGLEVLAREPVGRDQERRLEVCVADLVQIVRLQRCQRLAGHHHGNPGMAHLAGQAVGGGVVEPAGRAVAPARLGGRINSAVVRPMADDNAVELGAQVVAEPRPGRRDVLDHVFQPVALAPARLALDALEEAAVGRPDHGGVDGVAPVIPAVLRLRGVGRVVVGQEGIEAPVAPQHLGHLAGRHQDRGGAALGIETGEIFARDARDARQALGIDELPVEEPALLLEALHRVRGEAPLLVLGQARDQRLDHGPSGRIAPRLPRRAIALVAIGLAQAEGPVGDAVVQRARIGQDVIDIARAVKELVNGNRFAGVRAAAVHRVVTKLLPKPEQETVSAAVALTDLFKLLAAPPGGFGVLADCRIDLAFPFLVQLQVAGQLDHDLGGLAVCLDDPVHQAAQLVQPDMHGRIGDAPIARDVVVGRVVRARDNVSDEDLAVIWERLQNLPGAKVRMAPECAFRSLGVGDDLGLHDGEDLPCRRRPDPAVAIRQWRLRDLLGSIADQTMIPNEPVEKGRVIRIGLHCPDLFDKRPLPIYRQSRPIRSIPQFVAQHRAQRIAGNALARLGLKRETLLRRKAEHFAQPGERKIGARDRFHRLAIESKVQPVALVERQRAVRLSGLLDAQRVDGLVEDAFLKQRVRLGQARLLVVETTLDLRRLQGALVEDRLEEGRAQVFGQPGMAPCLRLPEPAELRFEVMAGGVEIVACVGLSVVAIVPQRQPCSHRWNLPLVGRVQAAPVQELTMAARA